MNNPRSDVSVYLLIDNGLLQEVAKSYAETHLQCRPVWLEPIYPETAMSVSPFLIDIETAYETGGLDTVMGYLNAVTPALHVSLIETRLDLQHIAQHLRRFICILDPEGKQFTLRYADCAVLEALASVLDSTQWATMHGPITRWHVHDRIGNLVQLPPVACVADGPTPLCLAHDQLTALDEESEPDHCIAKVKMMRHGGVLPGNAAEQHIWAKTAYQVWRAAENSNALILMFLTEAALLTKGMILQKNEIKKFFEMNEVGEFRKKLQPFIADHTH
ncbi:DUF4123 domain-containing protein [Massilia forsythiae]|uniref:DUF4123 domain-containing protein n=1 Tax=Massilia forsythiae TaxID=2728020 RepID=A0A7Z2VX89_9BURK|nr:DUF4123 domain-containing protein [Massilia forsythiae]QJE00765.1 DUF4123 domain-containing protein [Massilia forsythiae]